MNHLLSLQKIVYVHTFLFMDIAKGWDVYQLDVHNVFHHKDLKEGVYMFFPLSFSVGSPNFIRTASSLYGIK